LAAVRAWNEEAIENGWPTIRFLVFNSCESDGHAEMLSSEVDFAIGHEGSVDDLAAVEFSSWLWGSIFHGNPLLRSSESAKASSTSRGYRIFARYDPRQFRVWRGAATSEAMVDSGSQVASRTMGHRESDPTCEQVGAPVPRITDTSPGVDSGEFGTSEEYPVVAYLKKNSLSKLQNV
jgi:hypothetical protein